MAPRWWFRALGMEFGPISFDDLVAAARQGTLTTTDLVREGEHGLWRCAAEIESLFDRPMPFEANKQEWLVDLRGGLSGPLSLEQVFGLMDDQRLLSTDRIRRVDSSDWQPIDQVLRGMAVGSCRVTFGRALSEPRGFAPRGDNLEELILEILALPYEMPERAALAAERSVCEVPATCQGGSEPIGSTADPSPAYDHRQMTLRWRSRRNRWNPFRSDGPLLTGRRPRLYLRGQPLKPR